MTTAIHPLALKAYRDMKHWTQEQLAEATKGRYKVSLPTIKRIENTKNSVYEANDRTAEGLAKALGVAIEKLSSVPTNEAEREASLRQHGYRPLHTMLDAETALAFKIVQHIYGIPIRSQIVMAPLFATLLAEASLAWRRERVTQIEDTAEQLMALGGGHFSFARAASGSLEGAAEEWGSIAKRDLFGKDVGSDAFDLGFDPSRNNPFADFLDQFAQKVEAKTVTFLDRDWGWKTSEGMPGYRIGAELISDLTGNNADAEYALLRAHVRLNDIPADLLGIEKESDRIAWIIAQIPEDERAKLKKDREALDTLFGDNTISGSSEVPHETKEDSDA